MSAKLLVKKAHVILGAKLLARGFVRDTRKGWGSTALYRKEFGSWYLFIYVQHSRQSWRELQQFEVHLLRVRVDEPYFQYIRYQHGTYIPGSLVGDIAPNNHVSWGYTSEQELEARLHAVEAVLDPNLTWLENETSSMNYD
jgi:hypothetical protein